MRDISKFMAGVGNSKRKQFPKSRDHEPSPTTKDPATNKNTDQDCTPVEVQLTHVRVALCRREHFQRLVVCADHPAGGDTKEPNAPILGIFHSLQKDQQQKNEIQMQ